MAMESSMKPLANKVAIVTGGSRGIGAEISKTLARAGARVAVNYCTDRNAADAVVAEIVAEGGEGFAVRADVSQAADIRALFLATEERFGQAHILVNNAGIILYKRVEEITDEELDRILGVNVKGVFYALREAARRLADGGRIVNLSSSATRLMLPTYGAYVATKAAVEQLTRIFAKEIGPRGITVNSISPGPTNTELFRTGKSEETIQRLAAMAALGRLGEPDDVARVVLFLVSDDARWVTGQNLGVNGGFA
jgi:3-oxoacyl-[acyl-carrier protein] reductase